MMIVMSPLACLAAIIDGPLLGLAARHSPVHGDMHAGDLDRFVARCRRLFLLFFAVIASVVDYIHLPTGLSHHHFYFEGYAFELPQFELIFEIPEMSIHLTHMHAFYVRATLLGSLFIVDLIASSRAWIVTGLEVNGADIVSAALNAVCSCFTFRPYVKLAPSIDSVLSLHLR